MTGTLLYSRKLAEHYKPTIMEKNKNHLKKIKINGKKKKLISKLLVKGVISQRQTHF